MEYATSPRGDYPPLGQDGVMSHWWADQPHENLFMEVTRRRDIGVDLRAPLTARGGVATPGYALVAAVGPGDIVAHYDSAEEAITGVSRATGERVAQPIWWVARGTYARKAGEQARWLPGLSVRLGEYAALDEPIGLQQIRSVGSELLAVRNELERRFPKQSTYFPWTPYRDGVRTFQSYLAKLPRDAIPFLPALERAVAELEGRALKPTQWDPCVHLEREMAIVSGRPLQSGPRRGGQGFTTDQEVKVVVEAHAMNAALDHYGGLGRIRDTSRTQSYDYVVDIDDEEWHVEVKGTTGSAEEVLLTPNEVLHAADYPRVALFVLSNIDVARNEAGEPTASGGKTTVRHPWHLDPTALTPLGFKYRLNDPGGHA